MDREAVVATARAHVDAAGVGERSECHGGDFFASVPAGADGYLLSRILRDWDDDDAVRILATCRAAMQPSSRLLVVEAVIPERARDAPAAPTVTRFDLCAGSGCDVRHPTGDGPRCR